MEKTSENGFVSVFSTEHSVFGRFLELGEGGKSRVIVARIRLITSNVCTVYGKRSYERHEAIK